MLSEADSALGYLQGLGKLIRDPDLLIGPFLTREAIASTRIEGTRASLSDVFKAGQEVQPERPDDVEEVVCYLNASRKGLELIESLPITQRLIVEVHKVLMSGVRGSERQPGTIRTSPVWIGTGTHRLEDAHYVAPAPQHIGDLLTDWEKFVNEPSRIPVLVRCALMHYQFETIHPFLDGNGRIGRLLVGLMLISEGRLTTPLLYLSGYLENHRSEYYERLQAVRERGEMQEWVRFFLRAVRDQANDSVSRAEKLVELRERYLDQARSDSSRVSAIVPLIFQNPFISVSRVSKAAGVSGQGARNLLTRAEQHGWLSRMGKATGRGGRAMWLAQEVFSVIDEPFVYGIE
ncbi:Fic family protein [Herbihabitans rhizosphaerae]|uniref:Fic family protein n=1 Tax=Herbihabitans rhizosphaerae TaxID=1872711 RepID=UPI0013EED15E|nr:Fic/DOC family N-terminal domain-containing protein [Herbihabitans rhizosphaerae]